MNHVLYCDNFFTSGPLVEMLSKNRIFVVGTIRKRALGFLAVLKAATLTASTYVSTSVSGIQYFVFNDRKEVCFVTNVFPERMDSKVFSVMVCLENSLSHHSYQPTTSSWVQLISQVNLKSHMGLIGSQSVPGLGCL